MGLLIGFLTFILVVNCLLLMLLILIQLPKKDAGAGAAFGGGATDALFGAGSGNVLTKLTKYSSGVFLGLALLLSVLIVRDNHSRGGGVQKALQQKASATATTPIPMTQPVAAPAPPTNKLQLESLPVPVPANAPGTPAPAPPQPTPEKK